MHVYTLNRGQLVPLTPAETFDFFADAFNLEANTPPWLGFEVATPAPISMGAGTLIEYRLRLHALPLRWLTRIEAWEPGRQFVDRQLRGPYRLWHHTHTFAAHKRGTVVRDTVRYALPLGPLGRLARAALVRRDLDRIFDYRRDASAARLGTSMSDGYFTDDSLLRRVNRERALALAGPRALLMQAAHPLAVSGLLAHSTPSTNPTRGSPGQRRYSARSALARSGTPIAWPQTYGRCTDGCAAH